MNIEYIQMLQDEFDYLYEKLTSQELDEETCHELYLTMIDLKFEIDFLIKNLRFRNFYLN